MGMKNINKNNKEKQVEERNSKDKRKEERNYLKLQRILQIEVGYQSNKII